MKKYILILLFVFMVLLPQSVFAAEKVTMDTDNLKDLIIENAINVSQDFAKNKDLADEIPVGETRKPISDKAREIPVLMFHEVGYTPKKEYSDANFILKERLEAMMFYITGNEYTPITMEDVYQNWINGKELPEKPVVLTFDDGYASHFTYVKDVFQRFNAVGTFYIVQDRLFMGIENRNLDGVKKLVDAGMEIGVHTYSHPDFTNMTYDEIYKEVSTCKNFLEDNLGFKLSTFSYPYGNYNDAAIQVLKDLGFKTAVTTKEGLGRPDQFPDDAELKISRYNIFNTTTKETFIRMLNCEE